MVWHCVALHLGAEPVTSLQEPRLPARASPACESLAAAGRPSQVKGLGEAIVSGTVPGTSLAFTARKDDVDSPKARRFRFFWCSVGGRRGAGLHPPQAEEVLLPLVLALPAEGGAPGPALLSSEGGRLG